MSDPEQQPDPPPPIPADPTPVNPEPAEPEPATEPARLPPRPNLARRCCCNLVLPVLGFILVALLSIFGEMALDRIVDSVESSVSVVRSPHRALHHRTNKTLGAKVADERRLVRPFYGERGVQSFDLVATIYHRVQQEPREGPREGLGEEERREGERASWSEFETVYSQTVLKNLTVESKGVKTVVQVVLPEHVVSSLRNPSHNVQVTASFNIIPSSLSLVPGQLVPLVDHLLNTDCETNASFPFVAMPLSPYSHHDPADLKWKPAPPLPAIIQILSRDVVRNLSIVDSGAAADVIRRNIATHALVTRSMVSMVADFPVYPLATFKEKMRNVDAIRAYCVTLAEQGSIPADWTKKCTSSFAREGHFQSLYGMGTEEDAKESWQRNEGKHREEGEVLKDVKGWRYAPYLEAMVGGSGPRDRVFFWNQTDKDDPQEETASISFEWHISFSTVSPFQSKLGESWSKPFHGTSIPINSSNYAMALAQDYAEYTSAWFGHPFEPSSRAFLRRISYLVSSYLDWVLLLARGYYIYTRRFTTGESLPVAVVEPLFRGLHFAYFEPKESSSFRLPPIIVPALIQLVYWSFILRLRWTWFLRFIPVWVTKMPATRLERESLDRDMRFTWTQRGLTLIALFLFGVVHAGMPHLVSAQPPVDDLLPASEHSITLAFFRTLRSSHSIMMFLSQLLLNHRAETFGGGYRIEAVLDLVAVVARVLPIVLSPWWGKWEMMEPLTVWDVLVLGLKAARAWQAWRFRAVRQVEEEQVREKEKVE